MFNQVRVTIVLIVISKHITRIITDNHIKTLLLTMTHLTWHNAGLILIVVDRMLLEQIARLFTGRDYELCEFIRNPYPRIKSLDVIPTCNDKSIVPIMQLTMFVVHANLVFNFIDAFKMKTNSSRINSCSDANTYNL